MYRILVIPGARDAAGGTLDLETEIMLLANVASNSSNLVVDIIPPDRATELLIVEKLTTSNVIYDAVHWLGHSDNDGFYLSEYEILTEERIHAICRDAGARTVFFNSCESARLGQYLVNKQVAVCLCYSSVILDKQAILNALRFYTALARSNDPFEDGLRDAYLAADPGDGSLLWLTNGMFIQQIIDPLKQMLQDVISRLENMAGEHTESFTGFNSAIESTKNALRHLDTRVTEKITQLSSSAARTRTSLIALLAVVVLFIVILAWAASTYGNAVAQTIPPTRIGGTVPELPTRKPTNSPASPVPPTKKPKPTNRPASPVPPTKKPKPTNRPASPVPPTKKPKPTNSPASPVPPTKKPKPTNGPASPVPPTKKPKPTSTRSVILQPTLIPVSTAITVIPSNTPGLPGTATPTLSVFQAVVATAVRATVESWSGCSCQ